MNSTLHAWNEARAEQAVSTLLHCCAARRWAGALVAQRPVADVETLLKAADEVWAKMGEPDWMDAFCAHPRIGERKALTASAQSHAWSRQEQASVESAESQVLRRIAEGNQRYEQLFGFTYIVCATGKTAPEMLQTLETRLQNPREEELCEAAEQQRQITQIRLRKWLGL